MSVAGNEMTADQQGLHRAEQFRDEQGLGSQPLGDLVALIDQAHGCDVAVLGTPSDEHGMTIFDPVHDLVLIGVARTRHPMRQRSTLAHELAHALFQDWTNGTPEHLAARSFEERRADSFARHLLLPRAGIASFPGDPGPLTDADLSRLCQHFLASPAITAVALRGMGRIDESTKSRWMVLSTPALATRFGWRDQYDALAAESDQRRAPQRLLTRAMNGYIEGVVSLRTIATLRGMSVEGLEKELAEAGIRPKVPRSASLSADDLPDFEIDLSDLEEGETKPGAGT